MGRIGTTLHAVPDRLSVVRGSTWELSYSDWTLNKTEFLSLQAQKFHVTKETQLGS